MGSKRTDFRLALAGLVATLGAPAIGPSVVLAEEGRPIVSGPATPAIADPAPAKTPDAVKLPDAVKTADAVAPSERTPLAPVALPLAPVALTVGAGELLVASRTGWIHQIDPMTLKVSANWRAAPRLADLVWSPVLKRLLAVDPASRQLLVFAPADPEVPEPIAWREVERHPTASDPVAVQVSDDGQWIAVTCRWSRTVNVYRIEQADSTGEPRLRAWGAPVELTMAPQRMVWLGDHGRFLVADAFGGRLAALDPHERRVTHTVRIDGHNQRGLVFDRTRNEVVIAHQRLTSHLSTTHDHVFWGNVVSNLLMSARVSDLLDVDHARADFPPLAHWSLQTLGQNQAAGGDPAGVALLHDGGRVVCLAGVAQVAVNHRPWGLFQRVAVGRGPVAVVADPARARAYVASQFDDSVAVIDTDDQRLMETIRLQPAIPTDRLTAVQRGEMLFYDARLSLDGWFSCHSCHSDGHTNGLNNDNFGDAHEGAPKRVPSLLGTADTGPWTWRGLQADLGQQVARSIVSTMQGRGEDVGDTDRLSDLVAYLNSLPPAPGIGLARVESSVEAEGALSEAGRQLFERLKCADCHAGRSLTSSQVVDVGLVDESGERQFNPPSLLGVSQRDKWLHDGRAPTLRSVFDDHHHPDGTTQGLTPSELDALVAYLSSL